MGAVGLVNEGELCARFAPRILAFGRCHLRDAAAARDLVQEVLLLTIQRLRAGEVREPDKLGSFILGACRLVVQGWKRTGRRRDALLEQHGDVLVPGRGPVPVLDRAQLAGCLDGLPARDRAVVTLTFYEELGADEVASSLGMEPGHVRVVRHRALTRLRTCMGAES